MALNVGELVAFLRLDSNGFKRGLAEAEREAGKSGQSIASKLAKSGAKLESIGKDLTKKLTVPLLGAGVAAFKMAADTEDALGAADQIFGDNSDAMKKWAKGLPSYYGVARGEAHEYTNIMGSLLKNLGGLTEREAAKTSQKLVELAADLSAMFGGSTQTAVHALTGALKGNLAMLDNYGISATAASVKAKALEMGIADSTGALTDQQKQAATLAIIWEQTTDAQGQAAREAGGASGQMRALSAEVKNLAIDLGAKLLPIGTKIIGWASDMLSVFSGLSPTAQNAIIILGGIAAAAGPVMFVTGKVMQLAEKVSDFRSKLVRTETTVDGSSKKLTGLGKAVKGLGTMMAGLAIAETIGNVANQLGDYASKAEKALVRVRAALLDNDDEAAIRAFGDAVAETQAEWRGFGEIFSSIGRELKVGTTGIQADIENVDEAFKRMLQSAPEGAQKLVDALERQLDVLDPTSREYKDTADMVDRFRKELGDAAQAADVAEREQKELAPSIEETGDAAEDAAEDVEDLADELLDLLGVSRDVHAAERAFTDSVRKLSESMKENGKSFDESTDKGRANYEALLDNIEAAFDLADAQMQLDGTGKKSRATLQAQADALKRLHEQGRITDIQYMKLLDTYKLTPNAIETRITANTTKAKETAEALTRQLKSMPGVPRPLQAQIQALIDQGKYDEATRALTNLTARRTAYIDIITDAPQERRNILSSFNNLKGRISTRASGGPVRAGQPYLVGEEGPELIIPNRSGMVLPADVTSSLADLGRSANSAMAAAGVAVGGGGGGPVIVQNHQHFHGPVAGRDGKRWVAEQVQEATRTGLLALGRR